MQPSVMRTFQNCRLTRAKVNKDGVKIQLKYNYKVIAVTELNVVGKLFKFKLKFTFYIY